MAIIGTHTLLYSSEPEALRTMLRDIFGFPAIDAGGGWLICALPPAEMGVHPADGPTHDSGVRHQISFLCDNLETTTAELSAKGVVIEGPPHKERWGTFVNLALPGGVRVILYQPHHPTALHLVKP